MAAKKKAVPVTEAEAVEVLRQGVLARTIYDVYLALDGRWEHYEAHDTRAEARECAKGNAIAFIIKSKLPKVK